MRNPKLIGLHIASKSHRRSVSRVILWAFAWAISLNIAYMLGRIIEAQ